LVWEISCKNSPCLSAVNFNNLKLSNIFLNFLTTLVCLTNGGDVEDGANDGEEQDGAEVVEEQPVGHEVAGVQDDRRQHVQEEGVRRQRRHVHARRVEQQDANHHPHHDQQTRLGEHL